MNWIKSISVIFIVTVISIKCADLLLGYLAPESTFGVTERGTERSLNMREINPNFNAVLWPSEEYIKRTDSLERQGYLIRTDELGFIENGNEISFSEKTYNKRYIHDQNQIWLHLCLLRYYVHRYYIYILFLWASDRTPQLSEASLKDLLPLRYKDNRFY